MTNTISLSVRKIELILFKPKMKKLDFDLKLKLNGKRLYPTKSVKYLGIKTSHGLIILIMPLLSLTGLMLYYLK